MKYVFQQLKSYKKESILAPLFKMLEALFDLLVPLVMAGIIDNGIANGDKGYILGCCGLLALLALIGLCCCLVAQFYAAKAAVGCASGLRRRLFSHIQTLDHSQLDTLGGSTLITRMTSDINQVQNGLNLALRLLLRSPFIVFGGMILAFTINVKAALIFAAVIPLLTLIVVGVMRLTSPLYRRIQGKLDGLVRVARENLSGVRVVRAFGREQEETRRFESADRDFTRSQLFVGRISALMNPLTFLVVNLGIVALLNTGGIQVNAGVLQTGEVIALINYMSQILVELVKLANTIIQISRASACAGRIGSVLETQAGMEFPAVSPAPAPAPAHAADEQNEAVRFSSVYFRYANAGSDSLTDISFSASAGQTVGVIGGTGSGKTSLVNLIPRFYEATGGEVLLFGRPVQEWPLSVLRREVGVVPQRAQLFSGSIRTNLTWGEDIADATLWRALTAAQAADFVKARPEGLDAPVEQGGRNLSGGQRQRLTIARALVNAPRLLILDDSASALDLATDAKLRKAIGELSGVTVFIVSQRAASLRHADKILVLDDGRLVGCGKHEELITDCAVYREIYESQFKKGGQAL